MSGVFGYVEQNPQQPLEAILSDMGQVMTHRPWYQVDWQADAAAGVGLGRIGIGIFNGEQQPIINEAGDIYLCFAGEFYYQTPLRQQIEAYPLRDDSDAELALRLYQTHGVAFIKQVEGIFSIAIWDSTQRQLILFSDRFGLKPLYYAHLESRFLFAPEMKGLLQTAQFPKRLNPVAVDEFVRFQQLLGDKTFFEDIRLLDAATIYQLDLTTMQAKRTPYWDWRTLEPIHKIDSRTVYEESHRLFEQAIEARSTGQHRLGIYLSGGLDSRIIAASLQQYQPHIATITYGHRQSRDVKLAQKIATSLKLPHQHVELADGRWAQEVSGFHLDLVEGAHSWIHAHGLSTLPQARQMFEVNLSGFCGAVMGRVTDPFSQYDPPDQLGLLNLMHAYYTRQHTWPGLTESEARSIYTDGFHKQAYGRAYESLRAELAAYEHHDLPLQAFFFNLLNHDRRLILNFIVFNNSHIENRCPFNDYRLLDWLACVPRTYQAEKSIHVYILSQIAPKLGLIPWDRDKKLPSRNRLLRNAHHVMTRLTDFFKRSYGLQDQYAETLYADYEVYLRQELRPWGESLLSALMERDMFRPEAVQSLLTRHLTGREPWTIGKIASLMTLEMFLRRYVDG